MNDQVDIKCHGCGEIYNIRKKSNTEYSIPFYAKCICGEYVKFNESIIKE